MSMSDDRWLPLSDAEQAQFDLERSLYPVRGRPVNDRPSLAWALLVLAACVAVVFWSGSASAAAGTLTGSYSGGGTYSWSCASNSCADVKAGFDAYAISNGWSDRATACSADPVAVSSTVSVPSGYFTVTSITATAVAPAESYVTQEAFDALAARVTAAEAAIAGLQSSVATLQSQVGATPDAFDPAAAGAVFGFFFISAITLWLISKNFGVILDAVRSWLR